MSKTVLSGFTDEISSDFEEQLRAAVRMGLTHISLRSGDGVNVGDMTEGQFTGRVLPLLKKYGVRVSSIGSPLGKILLTDEDAYAAQLEMARRLCSYARRLDCKYVRIFSFYLPDSASPEAYTAQVLQKLRGFLEVFRGSGVKLLHENEKGIYGDLPERCARLAQELRGPEFALIFDFANFVQCGADPESAWELLRGDVEYIHIKDASLESGINVPCGQGDGRIGPILSQALRDGYSGFLTLEPHLVEFAGLGSLEKPGARKVIDTTRTLSPYESFDLQRTLLLDLLKGV